MPQRAVRLAHLEAASCELQHLPPRIAWQSGCWLLLRRLVLAPRGLARGAGPGRKAHGREAEVNTHVCEGAIFGTTLGNLLHHACGRKHAQFRALRAARTALAPAGAALVTCCGEDRAHLVRSLGQHRVLHQQAKRLRELKCAPRVYGASACMAIGAAAAVLATFSAMAVDPADAAEALPQLEACLRQVASTLRCWRLSASADADVEESGCAEMRAVQRALQGVLRAKEVAGGLPAYEALRLHLAFFRRAAWPAGERLDEDTHEELLERIRTGELVDVEQEQICAAGSGGEDAPGVVPLAAFPALSAESRPGGSSSSLSFAESDDPAAAASRAAFAQSRLICTRQLEGSALFVDA